MASLIVVGSQWGDEGKGKITDYLANQADMVLRCQGGSNAGHTHLGGRCAPCFASGAFRHFKPGYCLCDWQWRGVGFGHCAAGN